MGVLKGTFALPQQTAQSWVIIMVFIIGCLLTFFTASTNFVRLLQSNCTTSVFPGRYPCFQSSGGTNSLTSQYKICTGWFCNRGHIRFLSQSTVECACPRPLGAPEERRGMRARTLRLSQRLFRPRRGMRARTLRLSSDAVMRQHSAV